MKFKKSFLSKLVIILTLGATCKTTAETNKTFFMPKSVGQDAVLRYSNYNFFVNNFKKAKRFTLTNTAFYQQSTNGKELGKYFFPNNKTELSIKGSLAAAGTYDVSGTWLQIPGDGGTDTELYLNNFTSKISIKPQIKSFGDLLKIHVPFSVMKKNGWFAFEFPFMQVETNSRLREYDVANNRTSIEQIALFALTRPTEFRNEAAREFTPLNATEALNNPTWHYGKFKNGIQKLAGLADVGVYAGITPVEKKHIALDFFLKGILPTSYKPKAEYVFEPILGNAHHWGIGCGADLVLKLINKKSSRLNLSTKLELNYLFKGAETRSFDLTNGPWSRYLKILRPGLHTIAVEAFPLSGINFFTKQLNVSPGADLNWITSLSFNKNNFFIETGYDFWCKQKESVHLKNAWNDQEIAIAGLYLSGDTDDHLFGGATFSNATISDPINKSASFDGTDIYVTQNNLNINSAAHPSQITNKIYLNLGINPLYRNHPLLLSIGSSYEFANKNRSIEQWGLMFQFSTNF